MVFDSYTFVVFLACVLAVHYSRLSWQSKKVGLLLASYLFYGAWNPPFVLLLVISTIVDWFAAKWMYSSRARGTRLACLTLSLCTNLGMLAFFKYANFLMATYTDLVARLGITHTPPQLSIILPVGISFYTFQTLSYTIDVYRGKLEPKYPPIDFALYVAFLPQLVAGPIVRAVDFLPQLASEKRASASQFGAGAFLLLLGLTMKVVLADSIFSNTAEVVYASNFVPSTIDAWIGTIAFAGQIYCDFAGYSYCAIGIAAMLGFTLPDNFHCPYAAVGFSDFWRRWHISLSTWLRDYLYVPLGGNRHGQFATCRNLLITMLLGGLWHGPAWTFVAWGGLHGSLLIGERLLKKSALASWSLWQSGYAQFALAVVTFACVCLTWVLFRAKTFFQAMYIWAAMFGLSGSHSPKISITDIAETTLIFGSLATIHWICRDTSIGAIVARIPSLVLSLIVAAMLIAILMSPGVDRAFIYFQF